MRLCPSPSSTPDLERARQRPSTMKPHKSSPFSRKVSVAVATPTLLLLALAVVSLYDFNFAERYQYIRRASSSSFASPATTPSSPTVPATVPSSTSPASPANSSSSSASLANYSSSASPATALEACDLTRGQWVPDDEPSYYTNLTCPFIDDLQNCMKFGKPGLDLMRWRWKPDGCDLPRFDAGRFLEAMRGRSMAFVGDSLARNHVKSLLCILSQVAEPVELVTATETDVTRRAVRRDFHYGSHGFNVSLFWSPFLVKANLSNAALGLGLWDVHLDTADARWAAHIADFDYIVLSGTNWFFRPSVYYAGGRAVGRNGGASGAHNATETPVSGAVRAAFRTALGAIMAREGFRGKAVVRTVTPAHFENGEWNTGGDCVRTRPLRRGERARDAVVAEFRAAQVDALRETEAATQRNRSGAELRLLDITEAMELRPDGHPSRYGHPPGGSVEGSFVVDCLHWCLPGPIDLWSELLFHMLAAHPQPADIE
ncbi:protein trichome birefringence-like 19 [Triticum dicoccoides]|uniref:protein trichome birefringence-like 19 n=1 Tax=Triticum dicoccoides TaxID=85692 RepID=UPI001891D328|nr:protein trichome birefringence-like 19 [Triticum dicoccoides]